MHGFATDLQITLNSPPDTLYLLLCQIKFFITFYKKKQSAYVRRNRVPRIYRPHLGDRFRKRSDVSLYDHKFDLVYCQWNTRKPGVFQNISFLMLYYDNYISHYF